MAVLDELNARQLMVYNSLGRKKEPFEPIDAPNVSMYVCGITVYDYCHMGHAKSMVSFDTVARYLRAVGYNLTYVRNITDIDDKIIKRADETQQAWTQLTEEFINAMNEDCAALSVEPPDQEPRATAYMDNIIAMVTQLVEKGHAYAADNGDVYFEVAKFERYGDLAKKNLEELQAGARVEVSDVKRNALDFVLWKAAKPGEPAWSSPWGEGRPGWHIECSAMSTCCLNHTIDIHGGGGDLQFPHHENEIAQSEAATGETFVKYWLHNGFVQVANDKGESEKMSKSLGNFFTIREVLKQYSGEVIRYFILGSHYRSPLNHSEELLQQATESVTRLYQALRDVDGMDKAKQTFSLLSLDGLDDALVPLRLQFIKAMDDDFNTPKALAVLHELATLANKRRAAGGDALLAAAVELKALANLLGLLYQNPEQFFQGGDSDQATEIEQLIVDRDAARAAKDWAKADSIRDQLTAMGVVLEDKQGKTVWRKE